MLRCALLALTAVGVNAYNTRLTSFIKILYMRIKVLDKSTYFTKRLIYIYQDGFKNFFLELGTDCKAMYTPNHNL